MKIINHKKIFSVLIGIIAALPLTSFAQSSIADVAWEVTPSTYSAYGGGFMSIPSNSLSFQWQLEIGFPGEWTTNSNGSFEVNGNGEVFKYLPAYLPFYSSTPPNLTYNISSGLYRFDLPQNLIGTLWPASNYYLDVVEWELGMVGQQIVGEPLRDYFIFTTDPISNLSLNVNTQSSGSVSLGLQVPAGVNVYSPQGATSNFGMPVDFYLLSQDRSGEQIEDVDPALILWSSVDEEVFNSTGFISVTVDSGIINPGTAYYLKMINSRDRAGALPITASDILIQLPVSSGGGSGNGGSNPGFPSSGEEFEGGLITCDGIEEECDFEKLLLAINKIIRFIVFVIGVPIVTLSFAYAGFLMVTSGGNPSKKDEAKSIIGNAVVGLIVLLGAWIIVRTVLVVFGYTGPLLGVLGA
jgi:hypothetical protein